jgi:hypothetical protein
MTTPRFSIIIPTRERADTLEYALQSCLRQDFDDFEVVVCDNHSSPATRAVVEGCGSARVRYLRSPRLLAMSDNWELAVAQARGEYVHVLGDDDALLSFALREANAVLEERRPAALRWGAAFYTWPTLALPEDANYLALPLGEGAQEVEFPQAAARVVRFETCYTTLPMLYNSLIHRDLLAEARARAGRLFPTQYPDVYSGFALGAVAGRFVSLGLPLSISGQSARSTGIANLWLRGRSPIDREYRDLNERAGLPRHPWVADLPILPEVPVADSFLLAREALFPGEPMRLDRKAFARQCLDRLCVAGEADWHSALALVRRSIADEPELLNWFDSEQAGRPWPRTGPRRLRPARLGLHGGNLHLDAGSFGARDVVAAARLCEALLGRPGQGASLSSVSQVIQGLAGVLRAGEANQIALETALRHSEADRAARLEVIHRLDADRAARLDVIHRLDAALRDAEAERLAAQREAEAGRRTSGHLEEELRRFRRLPLAHAAVRAGQLALRAWRRIRRAA